jgi:hypothetical protein
MDKSWEYVSSILKFIGCILIYLCLVYCYNASELVATGRRRVKDDFACSGQGSGRSVKYLGK